MNFHPVHRLEQKNDVVTKSHHAGGRPCSLRGGAVLQRRQRRQEWSILRSPGEGRSAAHTDELCRGRPEDHAPRGCGWCCGRRCRCCGRLLWILMRAGRGRLRSGHDALLTSSSGPVEAIGCGALVLEMCWNAAVRTAGVKRMSGRVPIGAINRGWRILAARLCVCLLVWAAILPGPASSAPRGEAKRVLML